MMNNENIAQLQKEILRTIDEGPTASINEDIQALFELFVGHVDAAYANPHESKEIVDQLVKEYFDE